jgi:hypothetical protein
MASSKRNKRKKHRQKRWGKKLQQSIKLLKRKESKRPKGPRKGRTVLRTARGNHQPLSEDEDRDHQPGRTRTENRPGGWKVEITDY